MTKIEELSIIETKIRLGERPSWEDNTQAFLESKLICNYKIIPSKGILEYYFGDTTVSVGRFSFETPEERDGSLSRLLEAIRLAKIELLK